MVEDLKSAREILEENVRKLSKKLESADVASQEYKTILENFALSFELYSSLTRMFTEAMAQYMESKKEEE